MFALRLLVRWDIVSFGVLILNLGHVLVHFPSRDSLLVKLVQLGRGSSSGLWTEEDSANAEYGTKSGEEPTSVVTKVRSICGHCIQCQPFITVKDNSRMTGTDVLNVRPNRTERPAAIPAVRARSF